MQGIELSRRFFSDIVQPWLAGTAGRLRYSAALIGYGSELLGFDDEVSRDHNWGPRVQIFLSKSDFQRHARELVESFGSVAPSKFLGEPIGWRSRPHPAPDDPGGIGRMEHGLEFHTLERMLTYLLAIRDPHEVSLIQWLGFPEQRLLAFTSGAVFHDDTGHLTAAREGLAYFPDDVWFYKIACQWRRISEEQAFVGRAGQVGDDLGSRIIAARLVRDVMGLAFLLCRRYAPYPKWFGTAFSKLPLAASLSPLLKETLLSSDWKKRGEALASAYLELARTQKDLGIAPFSPVIGPYYERPFVTINADDAIRAAIDCVKDEGLRSHPIIGSIDQISDLTPVLVSPDLCHEIMAPVFQ